MTDNQYKILKLMKDNDTLNDLDFNDLCENTDLKSNLIGLAIARCVKDGYIKVNSVRRRGKTYHLLKQGLIAVTLEEKKRSMDEV